MERERLKELAVEPEISVALLSLKDQIMSVSVV